MVNIISRERLLESFSVLENGFKNALYDAQEQSEKFDNIRNSLKEKIKNRINETKKHLPENNPLTGDINNFISLLDEILKKWNSDVASRDRGIKFRSQFNDSLLIFVYGKVKSGKSSLGNFIAWGNTNPTESQKKKIEQKFIPQYFSTTNTQVKNGDEYKEAEIKKEFRVGATEATSSIQGFRLSGLTWVDSPGLHSINEENEKLAKKYADHADLILYTMSSDAPGRGSDLEEIKKLTNKGKKIVLLITGSDNQEEYDWDEQNNCPISKTVMKDIETRRKQQNYIRQELPKYHEGGIEIVSISARYAQENTTNQQLFADSGINQLYTTIIEIASSEGIRLKRQVPMLNFKQFLISCISDFDEYNNLIADFNESLEKLKRKIPEKIIEANNGAKGQIKKIVHDNFNKANNLLGESEHIIENKISEIQKSINEEIIELITHSVILTCSELINDLEKQININLKEGDLPDLPKFEIHTITKNNPELKKGNAKRNAAIWAIFGTIGGFFVGGPAGAAAGGALLSAAAGALSDKTKISFNKETIPVGSNLDEIMLNAVHLYEDIFKKQLKNQINNIFLTLIETANYLTSDINDILLEEKNNLDQLRLEIDKKLN